ncbi:uncharacterized protein L3040_000640 [Drepanopeziza brunnea f. sp. 'multigermtubi']|uniref:uncharacterized protein n=1 Tax=Drepanopeziza brunnea f. sp. 'multigermtubi' TaxID=698441 RepID=UPI002394D9F8|nr:hypothetical protein L3040_000640 [Drepanopeziza brunnea f. sp. 'multigermtubi']
MENLHSSNSVPRLEPRIPVPLPLPLRAVGRMESIINVAAPGHIVEPRQEPERKDCGENECEKPIGPSTYTLPIVLGIAVPVIGAAVTFFLLHRRHVRRQRLEDANDRHASMDFGLGDVPQSGRKKRKGPNVAAMDFGDEKSGGMSRRQISMDMGMEVNSPYLLPPELHNSRESIHSLSRNVHEQEDPYRPVKDYYPGDTNSMRSFSKQGSSIHTSSSAAPSRLQELGTSDLLSNAGQMGRGPPASGTFPPRQASLPRSNASKSPPEVADGSFDPSQYPAEPAQAYIPASSHGGKEERQIARELPPAPFSPSQQAPPAASARKSPPAPINTDAPSAESRPPRNESMPIVQAQQAYVEDAGQFGEGFQVTPPSPGRDNGEAMRSQRYSMDVPPEQFAQAGLGAPGFDPKRLSMGFRPLPPNAATESEDPETRANRIRSFYKEYFDESKPAPQGQYYEDYDENYLGEAAYYDSESNNFVMPMPHKPYADPMTRRAMTPPPRGPPRFQGQGQPRGRQGSMGAMSTASGGRGPPPGARAYSSASGRMGPPAGPKRPLPPPADLTTLPTPSKLRDDSFTLNPLDFAPPKTYRDRVAGRSESPLGERRPYSPMVPVYTPSASAFEELAPMPSPHMLRKSGTFTSLDFAAPRKFLDPENMSDAGSIRSNRSGISARQQSAIRNGAYRISKIPADVVFTKDDLAATLKPQWGLRQS